MQTVYGEVILRTMYIEESRIGQLEKVNRNAVTTEMGWSFRVAGCPN